MKLCIQFLFMTPSAWLFSLIHDRFSTNSVCPLSRLKHPNWHKMKVPPLSGFSLTFSMIYIHVFGQLQYGGESDEALLKQSFMSRGVRWNLLYYRKATLPAAHPSSKGVQVHLSMVEEHRQQGRGSLSIRRRFLAVPNFIVYFIWGYT